jgi:energy-coupling factor transporter ATP-binding protein EcfA2
VIKEVRFRKFKRFKSETVQLLPEGITLVAGGNNSGKSTLLHGLAVWEFCRTAIEMERGPGAFVEGAHHQGQGLGDDEFSPVAVPSLKHLWTNLQTQRNTADGDLDGYTLRIAVLWDEFADDQPDAQERILEFGLALSNDRLFVKVTDTNLQSADGIPVIAYLPPFAGIGSREPRVSAAVRRRRTGEGLAGAVLRNLLLDLHIANEAKRAQLRGTRSKVADADLRRLRQTDPWELLQQTLRERFSAELVVQPFNDAYHSYIRIDLIKGPVEGYNLTRYPSYNKRDLMVEGSGFLQWLSVYALATSPTFDVLLLDEPDAHLHPTLQVDLMESLSSLASLSGKQVLVATHSVELLRHWQASRIMEIRSQGAATRYLDREHQKVGLLAGLGSDYAKNLDPIRRAKRVLFVEGSSDETVLRAIGKHLANDELNSWPIWVNNRSHRERKQLFLSLQEDIPELVAVSLRDRDDTPEGQVDSELNDKTTLAGGGFTALTWRRRVVESYLLVPAAISAVTGKPEDSVVEMLRDKHSLAIGNSYFASDCSQTLRSIDGKKILWEGPDALIPGDSGAAGKVAAELPSGSIAEDFKKLFQRLAAVRAGSVEPGVPR